MKLLWYRLALTVALFLGWLGYLGYLVTTRPVTEAGYPLVLSRPQIITSVVDVVAHIDSPDEPVTVEMILWPRQGSPVKVGDRLTIQDIDKCHPVPRRADEKPPADFTGPGSYILPLRPSPTRPGVYEITPIPRSPGFHTSLVDPALRIYPKTAETLGQYLGISKPESVN